MFRRFSLLVVRVLQAIVCLQLRRPSTTSSPHVCLCTHARRARERACVCVSLIRRSCCCFGHSFLLPSQLNFSWYFFLQPPDVFVYFPPPKRVAATLFRGEVAYLIAPNNKQHIHPTGPKKILCSPCLPQWRSTAVSRGLWSNGPRGVPRIGSASILFESHNAHNRHAWWNFVFFLLPYFCKSCALLSDALNLSPLQYLCPRNPRPTVPWGPTLHTIHLQGPPVAQRRRPLDADVPCTGRPPPSPRAAPSVNLRGSPSAPTSSSPNPTSAARAAPPPGPPSLPPFPQSPIISPKTVRCNPLFCVSSTLQKVSSKTVLCCVFILF